MFQRFYSRMLSRRLVQGLSLSMEAEENMIQKLKVCTSSSISRDHFANSYNHSHHFWCPLIINLDDLPPTFFIASLLPHPLSVEITPLICRDYSPYLLRPLPLSVKTTPLICQDHSPYLSRPLPLSVEATPFNSHSRSILWPLSQSLEATPPIIHIYP